MATTARSTEAATSSVPTVAPTPTRAQRKRRAIVDAATDAFLANGYSRTTMDDIARLAAVSKQTVYMHFGDKERLLTEIVTGMLTAIGDSVDNDIALLAETADVGTDLRSHARRQLESVLQPQPMQLRRLVIAEAVSFPELGRSFYENGPGRTITEFTAVFARFVERDILKPCDPARAASDFNWLVMSEPINRAMLLGDDGPPDAASVAAWADQAVTTFLAAYGS